jgi:hypothetical protein
MTVGYMARRSGPEHDSAVRRLAGAQDELGRVGSLYSAAAGSRAETLAQERLSAGRAYVASREQWLHWIDEGESLTPWEDGVWARRGPAGPRVLEHGRVARELRGIEDRAGRRQVDLARAVAGSAKRMRALERSTTAATVRRDHLTMFSEHASSAGRSGRSHDA